MSDDESILQSFQQSYARKYADLVRLGKGANGVAYSAKEVASGTAVAVKLPIYGLDVQEQRDFRVPRLAPSARYADLYTIEPFTHAGGTLYALVSRFIPGITWEQLEARLDQRKAQADDGAIPEWRFAIAILGLAESLASALTSFHNQRYGHGDVHTRNVLVVVSSENPRVEFHAVLIDVGNASFGPRAARGESDLIRLDVRAAKEMLLRLSRWVPYPEFFRDAVKDSETAEDLLALTAGYDDFLGGLDPERRVPFDAAFYDVRLRRITASQWAGKPTWRRRMTPFLEEMSRQTGTESSYREAFQALLDRIAPGQNYPSASVAMQMTHRPVEDALRKLVSSDS